MVTSQVHRDEFRTDQSKRQSASVGHIFLHCWTLGLVSGVAERAEALRLGRPGDVPNSVSYSFVTWSK